MTCCRLYLSSLLLLGILVVQSCQTNSSESFSIDKAFKALPPDLVYGLGESALDSLIQFGQYIDPEGDEFETVVYSYASEDNRIVNSTFSFETGQRGFNKIQIKTFKHTNGDLVIIYSRYGGTPASFEPHELKRYNYRGGKLEETELGELPESINFDDFYKEETPDADRYELNVGYEFLTEDENTLSFISSSALIEFGEPNYFSKLTYRWDGQKFVRLGFRD